MASVMTPRQLDSGTFIDDGDDDPEPNKPDPGTFIDDGADYITLVAAVVAQDPEQGGSSTGQHEPATAVAVLDLEQGAPRVYHHLQLNGAEGTSSKETHFSRFQGIRHWLNTTRLYGPMLGAIRRWFWDIEQHAMMHADQERTWLEWLAHHKVGCTKTQATEVPGALELLISQQELDQREEEGKVKRRRGRRNAWAVYDVAMWRYVKLVR